MTNVMRLRPKRQQATALSKNENPYMPSDKVRSKFKLPSGLEIQKIAQMAETINLALLGIEIPHCKYPDRFEAGVRYGLAHNRRTDIKTHFRPLFSSGFCTAKMFYRKFAPEHQLAAMGSYKLRIDQHGTIKKMKDV